MTTLPSRVSFSASFFRHPLSLGQDEVACLEVPPGSSGTCWVGLARRVWSPERPPFPARARRLLDCPGLAENMGLPEAPSQCSAAYVPWLQCGFVPPNPERKFSRSIWLFVVSRSQRKTHQLFVSSLPGRGCVSGSRLIKMLVTLLFTILVPCCSLTPVSFSSAALPSATGSHHHPGTSPLSSGDLVQESLHLFTIALPCCQLVAWPENLFAVFHLLEAAEVGAKMAEKMQGLP
uniref:Uncharacterized protein LOC110216667 n=1 Tax=Phascolarctos cinereus TaxID=38626 RepID=A0A6P5L829_PHACI|nr:uncharacterized protein LOC110216667 [Phascolarctos cinereus]